MNYPPSREAVPVRAQAGVTSWIKQVVEIAEACQANDPERLEQAIDAAEAHGLIPHTARMRIILAQRSGKHAPLIQARAVLERLGDRHFLRRLQAVEASLRQSNA